MKLLKAMIITTGLGLVLTSCGSKTEDPDFKYSIDEFADIEVLRYQVPGWDDLTLQQKEYIYHLSEAAKSGRDIIWDQNFKYNLEIRHALEAILEKDSIHHNTPEWKDFLVYAKRVFFSNGIHCPHKAVWQRQPASRRPPACGRCRDGPRCCSPAPVR